jgi:hypothetical protein
MMIPTFTASTLALLLVSGSVAALPQPLPDLASRQIKIYASDSSCDDDVQITPDTLTAINVNMTSCNATAAFAEECRNATQSAPLLNQAFAEYNISSTGEKAALLSLMVFETGNFMFDRNQ